MRLPVDTTTGVGDEEFLASVGSAVSRRLLEAALVCFADHGYHATTTREIATRCGLSPSGVYVHFATKSDLLYALALWGHRSALHAVEQAALETRDAGYETRLRRVIKALVRWHVDHRDLARVVAYEQDALPEARRETLRPLRGRFFEVVEGDISAGRAAGEFWLANPVETTRALLSLCTDICRWYRDGREPGAEDLGDRYADIAIRLVRE